MKLIELWPRWIRYEERKCTPEELAIYVDPDPDKLVVFHPQVDKIEDAQGIIFLCPKCFIENGSSMGTHSVICWSSSRGVPDSAIPGPGRWMLVGTSFEDLSLMEEPGKSRSVLLIGGCAWHGFVTNGEVT